MEIYFTIDGPDRARWSEEQARAALAAGTLPTEDLELSGRLCLRQEGQPALDFNDDLSMLMPNCSAVAASLRASGSAELRMVSFYCHLHFTVEGDTLRIQQTDSSRTGEVVGSYPKEAFLEAWTGCIQRFIAYAAALAELDPQWAGLHADLVESAAQA